MTLPRFFPLPPNTHTQTYTKVITNSSCFSQHTQALARSFHRIILRSSNLVRYCRRPGATRGLCWDQARKTCFACAERQRMRPASSVVGYGLNNKARQYAFPPQIYQLPRTLIMETTAQIFFPPSCFSSRSFVRLFYSFISNIVLFLIFFEI